MERLWAHSITLRTRLVDTARTPMLLKTVVEGHSIRGPSSRHE